MNDKDDKNIIIVVIIFMLTLAIALYHRFRMIECMINRRA